MESTVYVCPVSSVKLILVHKTEPCEEHRYGSLEDNLKWNPLPGLVCCLFHSHSYHVTVQWVGSCYIWVFVSGEPHHLHRGCGAHMNAGSAFVPH